MTHYLRQDFSIEEAIENPDGSLSIQLALDPRRYRVEVIDGERIWIDKYFQYGFSEDDIRKAIEKSSGVPVHHLSPAIQKTESYVRERVESVKQENISGKYTPPSEKALPHEGLAPAEQTRDITFLSIDVAESTKLQKQFGESYQKSLSVLIREIGSIIGLFHGRILKLTGDGLIAYVDHPSINRQCDNTVDLGLSIVALVSELNKARQADAPELRIRIGAEHGATAIKQFSVPTTGFSQIDVFSDALNLAVKVQEAAPLDTFIIGRALYERLHIDWLERSNHVDLSPTLPDHLKDYKTYQVR
jgi:class 3 adenylate cyclase